MSATISVIAGKEIILLVKEEYEGYYLDSAEDFTGQQCPASFGTTGMMAGLTQFVGYLAALNSLVELRSTSSARGTATTPSTT